MIGQQDAYNEGYEHGLAVGKAERDRLRAALLDAANTLEANGFKSGQARAALEQSAGNNADGK
jgi:hypothetical protein